MASNPIYQQMLTVFDGISDAKTQRAMQKQFPSYLRKKVAMWYKIALEFEKRHLEKGELSLDASKEIAGVAKYGATTKTVNEVYVQWAKWKRPTIRTQQHTTESVTNADEDPTFAVVSGHWPKLKAFAKALDSAIFIPLYPLAGYGKLSNLVSSDNKRGALELKLRADGYWRSLRQHTRENELWTLIVDWENAVSNIAAGLDDLIKAQLIKRPPTIEGITITTSKEIKSSRRATGIIFDNYAKSACLASVHADITYQNPSVEDDPRTYLHAKFMDGHMIGIAAVQWNNVDLKLFNRVINWHKSLIGKLKGQPEVIKLNETIAFGDKQGKAAKAILMEIAEANLFYSKCDLYSKSP